MIDTMEPWLTYETEEGTTVAIMINPVDHDVKGVRVLDIDDLIMVVVPQGVHDITVERGKVPKLFTTLKSLVHSMTHES